MKKVRKISDNESLYMDFQDISTTFALQFVLEFENQILVEEIQNTLNTMQKILPSFFVKAEDKYWVENHIKTKVIKEKTNIENILSLDLFQEKMDFKKETIQVYIFENKQKNFLIFRFSHCAFDAKSCILFLEIFFKIFNKKEYETPNFSFCETGILKKLNFKKEKIKLYKKYSLNTKNKINDKIIFKVISSKNSQYLMSKLIKNTCLLFRQKNVKFMIPTDLRRHNKEKILISNLALPIFINVNFEDDISNIEGKILWELKNKNELNYNLACHKLYFFIPKIIRQSILKFLFSLHKKSQSFCVGGIFSHIGKISLKNFNLGNNQAKNFFCLPTMQFLSPFIFSIVEQDSRTNIVLAYYQNQIDYTNEKNLLNV